MWIKSVWVWLTYFVCRKKLCHTMPQCLHIFLEVVWNSQLLNASHAPRHLQLLLNFNSRVSSFGATTEPVVILSVVGVVVVGTRFHPVYPTNCNLLQPISRCFGSLLILFQFKAWLAVYQLPYLIFRWINIYCSTWIIGHPYDYRINSGKCILCKLYKLIQFELTVPPHCRLHNDGSNLGRA